MEGRECEVDAVCDGERVLIPGIMEHVERAGVHSGDSMAIYPGLNLTEAEVDTLVDYTTRIGLALGVRGLMNIQFVLQGGSAYRSPSVIPAAGDEPSTVYVLEVNPRGSRTIPFISKVTGVPVANLATRVMLDGKLRRAGLRRRPVAPPEAGGHQGPRVLNVQAGGRGLAYGAGNEVHRRSNGH